MQKTKKSLIKKNVPKKQDKKTVNQIENSFNNNTMTPIKDVYNNNETINLQMDNINNLSNNESNIIANILETNNVKNDFYKSDVSPLNKTINDINFFLNSDYNKKGDFSFINISKKVEPFLYKPQNVKDYSRQTVNNFKFLGAIKSYRMIINILLDDDSLKSSKNLSKIFESINKLLQGLREINITNEDFLVCIFFQHFSNEQTFDNLFPGLNYYNCNNWNLKINNFYCSYGYYSSINNIPINSLLFYKESSTFIEIYKFFYCYVLNDIINLTNADAKEIDKTFLLVNWPNGRFFESAEKNQDISRILNDIFLICNNSNMILIPDINYYPNNKKDLFGYVNKYCLDSDKIDVNLFWDMICTYPVDHRFFFVNMNFKLYLTFKEYYQNDKIDIYSNEHYHDYHLCIFLKDNMKNIIVHKLEHIKIGYNDISLNFIDYFYDYILRKGSEYAIFFKLISYFFSWKNMTLTKFLQKIFLLIKLLSFTIKFFWFGLSFLVAYSVFNDTFGSDDNKMDYFGSLGYVVIIIILLFISLVYIKNTPRIKTNKIYRNLKRDDNSIIIITILYFIHYIYFFFFIICSVVALIHIKQGKYKDEKNDDYYIFNSNLFIFLFALNIVLYILPSFFRPSIIFSKGFLLYLILQLPNCTCFFHLPYLFTCIRNINSKKKSKESLYISLYVIFNGLLTAICLVFETKRQRRMDFLFILFIILTVINGAKLIILFFGFCFLKLFNKNIIKGNYSKNKIINQKIEGNNIENKNSKDKVIDNDINTKDESIGKQNLEDIKINKDKKNNNQNQNLFHLETKNTSQLDINVDNNKSIFDHYDNNLKYNRRYSSNKIEFKNIGNKLEKECKGKSLPQSVKNMKGIKSSYNLKNFNHEIFNDNIYNQDIHDNENNQILNQINYPLDTAENNVVDNNNNIINNNIDLKDSNKKSDNYPNENINSFSLSKSVNNTYNNNSIYNNVLNASDIEKD